MYDQSAILTIPTTVGALSNLMKYRDTSNALTLPSVRGGRAWHRPLYRYRHPVAITPKARQRRRGCAAIDMPYADSSRLLELAEGDPFPLLALPVTAHMAALGVGRFDEPAHT